jgi:hypothetical protein
MRLRLIVGLLTVLWSIPTFGDNQKEIRDYWRREAQDARASVNKCRSEFSPSDAQYFAKWIKCNDERTPRLTKALRCMKSSEESCGYVGVRSALPLPLMSSKCTYDKNLSCIFPRETFTRDGRMLLGTPASDCCVCYEEGCPEPPQPSQPSATVSCPHGYEPDDRNNCVLKPCPEGYSPNAEGNCDLSPSGLIDFEDPPKPKPKLEPNLRCAIGYGTNCTVRLTDPEGYPLPEPDPDCTIGYDEGRKEIIQVCDTTQLNRPPPDEELFAQRYPPCEGWLMNDWKLVFGACLERAKSENLTRCQWHHPLYTDPYVEFGAEWFMTTLTFHSSTELLKCFTKGKLHLCLAAGVGFTAEHLIKWLAPEILDAYISEFSSKPMCFELGHLERVCRMWTTQEVCVNRHPPEVKPVPLPPPPVR